MRAILPDLKETDEMKTLLVTIALAVATPAFADDYNDNIRLQGQIAQQQLQQQMDANAAAVQQRQQMQFNRAAQCAAQNYRNCY